MHGQGFTGALWSVVRRQRMEASALRGLTLILLLLTWALSYAPQRAYATIIDETITGTVASGTDISGVFGAPNTNLAGDDYTLVYATDTTQGTQNVQSNFLGIPNFSQFSGGTTAALTITNPTGTSQTYIYNALPSDSTISSITRNIGQGPQIISSVVQNYTASFSGGFSTNTGRVSTTVGLTNPPVTPPPSYLWSSPITYSVGSIPPGCGPPECYGSGGSFSISSETVNSTTGQVSNTQAASGTLNVATVTVGGPTPLSPVSPQIVYLDFNAGASVFNGISLTGPFSDAFTKVSSGFSPADESKIMSEVQSIYSKYLVSFVDTPPPADTNYDTIYIGGTPQDLPVTLQTDLNVSPCTLISFLSGCTNGKAQINYGNAPGNVGTITSPQLTNTGIVFSGNPSLDSALCLCTNIGLVGEVVAHETGHLLGLQHVADNQLMYPITPDPTFWNGVDYTVIGGPSDITITKGNVIVDTGVPQDSDGLISCFVGVKSTGERDCSTLTSTGFITIDVLASSVSEPLDSASLVVVSPGAESDDLPMLVPLGDLLPSSEINVTAPIVPGDTFFIEGIPENGGAVESLGGTYSGFPGLGGTATFDVTGPLVTPVPEPDSIVILISALGMMACLCRGNLVFCFFAPLWRRVWRFTQYKWPLTARLRRKRYLWRQLSHAMTLGS